MSKNIKKNYILNLSFEVLKVIIPLVVAPYLARTICADGIGQYSFDQSVLTYFVNVAYLGLTSYGNREVSYYQDDKEKRSEVFWNTVSMQAITTITMFIVYSMYAWLDGSFLKKILAVQFLVVFTGTSWMYQGLEEFGKIVGATVAVRIINAVLIFLLVKTKSDLWIYYLLMVGLPLIENIYLIFKLPKYVNKPDWKKIRPFSILKPAFFLFLPTVAIKIYATLDKTMIGLITNDNFQNGYYEVATHLYHTVIPFISAMGTVLIPKVGFNFKKGNKEEIVSFMTLGLNFAWFLGIPLFLGMFFVSENFIPWYYGISFTPVISLLKVLSCMIIIIGMSQIIGLQYLIPTGQEKRYTISVTSGAVINLILNSFMIPKFGSLGAAIASVAAELTVTCVQIYFMSAVIPVTDIISFGSKKILSGLFMSAVLFTENKFLIPTAINTMIMVASGGVVYILSLFLLQDEFVKNNVSHLVNRLKLKRC